MENIEHRNFMEYYEDPEMLAELINEQKLSYVLENLIVDFELQRASQEDLIDAFRAREFEWLECAETKQILDNSLDTKELYREILEKIFPIIRARHEEAKQLKDEQSTRVHEVQSNQQQSIINGIQTKMNKTEEG
jgi:hypothetical protein